MKITAITAQVKSQNRVNVIVEGVYRFSLDVYQVAELGIRVGKDYSEADLARLEEESAFSKLYGRALEYAMLRPHSVKEVKDYLWRKTLNRKVKNRKTGELKEVKGINQVVADRVLERLVEKRYVDDLTFARWWVENRNVRKGTSFRKLERELRQKGVATSIVQEVFSLSERDEHEELRKIIKKKKSKYTDEKQLIAYLIRLGFPYDDVRSVLSEDSD